MSKTEQRAKWLTAALVTAVLMGIAAYELIDPVKQVRSLASGGLSDSEQLAPVAEKRFTVAPDSNPRAPTENIASPSTGIPVHFERPVDVRSLQSDSVTILGAEGPVPVTWKASDDEKTLTLVPHNDLNPASHYNVIVSGARDVSGASLPTIAFGLNTAEIPVTGAPDARLSSTAAAAPAFSTGVTPYVLSTSSPATSAPASSNRAAGVTTQAGAASIASDTDERWQPTAANRHGRWRTDRSLPENIQRRRNDAMSNRSHWLETQPSHMHHAGELAASSNDSAASLSATATVSGVVLRQNDRPLAGVVVSLGNISGFTDANGEFSLTGLTAGQQELVVDGRKAGNGSAQYGYFVIGVNVAAKTDTPVPPIYLPKIVASDWISVPSPIAADTVVHSPAVPGMEIHLPKGAALRDHEGKLVTQIAIVPMPLDRSPFPFPENAPAYVSVQPGGMTVQGLTPGSTAGIRVVYPNQTDLKAGERVFFWTYTTDSRGWQIYGEGTASADGTQVVPNEGVALYESVGFMYTNTNPPAPNNAPAPSGNGSSDADQAGDGGANKGSGDNSDCNNQSAGDPVDCKSGLFVVDRTDAKVSDLIPISIRRTYRPGDTVSRAFGYGNSLNYGLYLREVSGTPQRYQQYDLILGDGSSVRFNRTSPSDGNYMTVVALHNTSASDFYAAVLDYESGNYVVTKKEGTKYIFSLYGTLKSIKDRFGNHLDLTLNNGQISRVASPAGRYTDLTYDSSNRVTKMVDSSGRSWTYQYSPAGNLTQTNYPDSLNEQYTYDPSGRMLTLVDRRSVTVVSNQYDANGRVSVQTLPDGNYTFAYTLDSNGNVIQTDVTDPRNNIRRVTYNAQGYKASVTSAAGTPLAQTTTFERDSVSGLITATVDPLGRRTEFVRDTSGNVTQVTRLAGTANALVDSYTYTTYSLVASHTDPNHNATNFYYNTNGCLTSVTDPLSHTTTLTCNAAGQPLTVTDALSHQTSFGYDAIGNVGAITDNLGQTTLFVHDGFGRLTSVTDPLGRQVTKQYDAMGRVFQVTDPMGKSTSIAYDNNGNILSVTDPNTGKTQFGYDSRNRRTSRTDALNQVESWTYDGVGNLLSYTDRKHQLTTLQYDVLDRLSLVTYADGSTVTPSFDAGTRLVQVADSVSGTITRGYNGLDELTQEQTPQGTVNYLYDAAGRRTQMTAASQLPVTYSYDNANRLTQIVQGTETVGFGYDAANRPVTLTIPNGVVTSYGYDSVSRLTGITYATGTGTQLSSLRYSYNQVGQLVSTTGGFAADLVPTPTNGTNSFDLNNRQTLWNGFSLGYDANGDPTSNAATNPASSYTFDARHRLTQISQNGTATATFTYDTFGRRTSKTISGAATTFLFDGLNTVQESQGGSSATILAGLGVDQRFARDEPSGRRYFLTDILRSTQALLDTGSVVQQTYGYEPYGEVTLTGSSNNPYQYAGRENDGTGFYYYRARYYSPTMKRFISEDPIGLSAGLNEYAYAGDNPISNTDPSGMAVYLGAHPAAFSSDPFLHAAIVLIPDNPGDFNFPNNMMTLGGQPFGSWMDSWSPFGNLHSSPNNPGDNPGDACRMGPLRNLTLVTPAPWLTDSQFIQNLIDAANSYQNNRPYDPFPIWGEYNSNSYAAGVILAAGGIPPIMSGNLPGYSHPLPLP